AFAVRTFPFHSNAKPAPPSRQTVHTARRRAPARAAVDNESEFPQCLRAALDSTAAKRSNATRANVAQSRSDLRPHQNTNALPVPVIRLAQVLSPSPRNWLNRFCYNSFQKGIGRFSRREMSLNKPNSS